MGWLHSRPVLNEKDKQHKSRAEQLESNDPRFVMPESDQFIVNAWHDIGLVCRSGDSTIPVTFTELNAFSDGICELDEFEKSQIVRMSRIFLNEKAEATESKFRSSPLEKEVKGFNAKLKAVNQELISKRMNALGETGLDDK